MSKKATIQETPLGNRNENKLVMDIYNNSPNYKIEINDEAEGNLCVIYFSSNGIYVKNTEEEFSRVIIKKDRFEWQKTKIEKAKKHIFLRDVTKNGYLDGINSKLNTMHKIIEFLRVETKGYRVVTLGSSSGGYCAFVAGVMLEADYIFSFTGQFSYDVSFFQFDLCFDKETRIKRREEKKKYADNHEIYPYFDILNNYMKRCEIPIFFFTSTLKMDMVQANLVKGRANVFTFEMDSDDHRLPVYIFNFSAIINSDPQHLLNLGTKYAYKKISKFKFSVEIMGFKETVKNLLRQKVRNKRSKIFD
jgi:hypothetical protein